MSEPTVASDNNTMVSFTEGPAVASNELFYAYIHNIKDDNTWRITIIFATRDVADEWWRVVDDSDLTQLQNIQRVTPQFYTHDPSQWNFFNFFIDSNVKTVSDKFRGKMFFVLENDRAGRGISLIPLQCIIDYTSGSLFCIRSKSDTRRYWDIDDMGRIYVSDSARTSFVVTANNVSKKTIMVGSDLVTLHTSRGAVVLHKSNDLVPFSLVKASASEAAHLFRFKDLKEGRFFVDGSGLVCLADQAKSGMAWELAM